MTEVVFAHDNRFVVANGNVYSEFQFPAAAWKRYLDHFDEVRVVARKAKSIRNGSLQNYELSSQAGVAFRLVNDLSGIVNQFYRFSTYREVEQVVKSCSGVIARLPSEIGLLAIDAAVRNNKMWAVEVAGCAWDAYWNHGGWQARAYAPLISYRVKRAVARAPFVLYVTKSFLQRRYPNGIGTTVACSNVEIDTPDDQILAKRLERISSRREQIVFGLIGTLHTRYKGIQTALEALSLLRGNLPNLRFRVLGGGPIEPWIKETKKYGLKDLVTFDGTRRSGEEVLKWLDGIDIYLQPSLQEGLPRALIEAMSRGCPAIGSDLAGIPELLPKGCLHTPGDAKSLASRISESLSDPGWKATMARRNWERASAYARPILEARRRDFWGRFSRACDGSA